MILLFCKLTTSFLVIEVDYAHTLRKLIIPVIIDIDYVPDGWLGELIQVEKTFDFSRRSMFNGSLDALLEYTKSITGPKGSSTDSHNFLNKTGNGEVEMSLFTILIMYFYLLFSFRSL